MNSLTSTLDSESTASAVPALYYDGRTAACRTVEVRVERTGQDFELRMEDQGRVWREPLTRKATAGRVASARHLLALSDGGTLEILDASAFDRALRAAGYQDGERLVRWLERSWPVALAAMVAIVFGGYAFVTWGVPALASRAVRIIPRDVDKRIGAEGLTFLDRGIFKPSNLSQFRQAQLRGLFARIAADAGPEGRDYRLELRVGGPLGANAFALPSGVVVMTDELVNLARNDDELRGVLAHEVGHLVHRHAMRQLVQQSAGALVMVGIIGDVSAASTLAASIPTVLVTAAYSRDFEREADAFSVDWMRRHQVEPGRLADLLTRLTVQKGGVRNPLLANHPGLAERIKLAGGPTGANPDAADTLVNSGNEMLNKNSYDAAIMDFNRALESDSGSSMAYADRAIAEMRLDKIDLALKDLDEAERFNGSNSVVFNGRGWLAYRAGDYKGAVAAFDQAVAANPQDTYAIEWRAYAHARLDETGAALADASSLLDGHPDWIDMYVLRARLLRVQGTPELALHDAASIEVDHPGDAKAYLNAARIYAAINDRSRAMQAYDRAVELSPDVNTYLMRAGYRLPGDIKGRRADIQAARTLDPQSPLPILVEAQLLFDERDYAAEVAVLNESLARQHDELPVLAMRTVANARLGRDAASRADLDRALALATTGNAHNNICWILATTGTALETALSECDAAIALAPADSAYLDSRGMALLRLNRYAEAVASYDRAVQLNPDAAISLYARGIAKRRLGMRDEGDADIQAALNIDPDTTQRFASFGLKP